MTTLDQVSSRTQARVMIIDGGHGVRSHLNTLGIHVGDWVTVVEKAPFRGPVLVEVHGTRFAIGRGLASKISVDYEGYLKGLGRSDRATTAQVG
jgi:ferrous iron transport protein A